MTPQQKRLYDIIKADLDATGVCPSYREMAERMGLKSKSGIHGLVCQLEESGHIIRRPHRDRSIELSVVIGGPKWREASDVISAALKIRPAPWRKGKTVTVSKESYQALRKALAKLGAV